MRIWRLILLIPSKDGHIRAAQVVVGKTRRIINRTINKLYPIEFSKENDSNEIPNDKDEDFESLNENKGSSKC